MNKVSYLLKIVANNKVEKKFNTTAELDQWLVEHSSKQNSQYRITALLDKKQIYVSDLFDNIVDEDKYGNILTAAEICVEKKLQFLENTAEGLLRDE